MKKILMVVDYQNDFVDPKGALPIPNAHNIFNNIQNKINDRTYENIIYTFDTHTPIEYNGSDEQKLFPDIHCEFGTKGWQLYNIKPRNFELFDQYLNQLKNPFMYKEINDEWIFTKNVFDIWQGNTKYPNWIIEKFPNQDFEIDVVGVAFEFCVLQNIQGLIERNYKVNLIKDCVASITKDGEIEAYNKMIELNVNFI